LLSKIRVALATILWPAISLMRAVVTTRKYGQYVTQQFGVSLWKQLAEQILLANRYNVPSTSYYKFKLFHPAYRKQARLFIHHHEIVTLLPRLYHTLNACRLEDKVEFFENCMRHGLPTASIIAVAEGGSLSWRTATAPEALPRGDLICVSLQTSTAGRESGGGVILRKMVAGRTAA
jgi:hypothetical protein